MIVEGSLPCSQKSANGPHSEADESRPHPHMPLFLITLFQARSGERVLIN
jgi:hypothetical protein